MKGEADHASRCREGIIVFRKQRAEASPVPRLAPTSVLPGKCPNCGAAVDPSVVGAMPEPRCVYCRETLEARPASGGLDALVTEAVQAALAQVPGGSVATRTTTRVTTRVRKGHLGPDGAVVFED
jgi:hypothetical protein